jgi:hypothetical protein
MHHNTAAVHISDPGITNISVLAKGWIIYFQLLIFAIAELAILSHSSTKTHIHDLAG